MKKLAFLFLTVIASNSFAKPMQVEVIGENWTLGYDIGEVAFYAATMRDGYFQYVANNRGNNDSPKILMLLEVKDILGQNKDICYDKLWEKNVRDYEVDTATVKRQSFPRYEQVTYLDVTDMKGASYYFAKNGKCIDVHISVPKNTLNAENLMTEFGRNLKF